MTFFTQAISGWFTRVQSGLIVAIFLLITTVVTWQVIGQSGNQVTIVSAASFASNAPVSPESIVSAFGNRLATKVEAATTLPLPTELAGTTVKINGVAAGLLFVAPTQINFLMPAGIAIGNAQVVVTSGDGTVSNGVVQIAQVSPGIFSADASGKGLANAIVLRMKANGLQSSEPVARFDPSRNQFVAVPIDPGPESDQLFLLLFGTGIRGHSNLASVSVQINGLSVEALYAGAPGDFFLGLDQVNVRLPRILSGRGRVAVKVKVGSIESNAVEIEMGGPDLRGATTTTLTASPNPSVVGQAVTFTARVNAVAPATGTPTGSVMITDNGMMIGKAPLDAAGQFSISRSMTSIGTHTIKADYDGDAYFKGSSATLPDGQSVGQAQSSVNVMASPDPATRDQEVTLTATVRPNPPGSLIPTGVVQFKRNGENLRAPITLTNGKASLGINTLALGSHSITAEYYGDPNFSRNTSAVYPLVISNPPLQVGSITRLEDVWAGDPITINGSGFSSDSAAHEVLVIDEGGKAAKAQVIEASSTHLNVRVPFGAGTGRVKVKLQSSEGDSPEMLPLRSSVSGFVQEAVRQPDGSYKREPIPGLKLRAKYFDKEIDAVTNSDGSFVVKFLPPIEVSGRVDLYFNVGGALPFPEDYRSIANTRPARDNQYSGDRDQSNNLLANIIELKRKNQTTSTTLAANTPTSGTNSASANPSQTQCSSANGQVVFDPGSGQGGNLTLTCLDPGRTPSNLPVGYFSSTIVQITPFRTALNPGSKLTFPNSDGIPVGTPVRVFRFDQTPHSQTLGKFIDVGAATISADGTKIETAPNTVTQSSYYFVSRLWPKAAIRGFVVDADADRFPVRRAVAAVRGQAAFTNNNGGFVLQDVPVITPDGANDQVTIEVSFVRPDGSVARAEYKVIIKAGEQDLEREIVLPRQVSNRRPQIVAPASLVATENEPSFFNIVIFDPDGQILTANLVAPPPFASLSQPSNGVSQLSLRPGANSAGNYTLLIEATDNQGAKTRHSISLLVQRANSSSPVARYQSVTTDEDRPITIALDASDPNGGTLDYRLVSEPAHGRLTGIGRSRTYQPDTNYNGSDSFNFKVISNGRESNVATVFIAVNPVNDPPRFDPPFQNEVPVSAGQTLRLNVTATDPDTDQTLTFTATDLPLGASFSKEGTGHQLRWTPTFTQEGRYTVKFKVEDNAPRPESDSRSLTINVKAQWAQTSGPEGGIINSLLNSDGVLYAATNGDGIYRSADNGRSWTPINNGLSVLFVQTILVNNNSLFAAAGGGGVYRFTDNGQNWRQVNNGLPALSITALVANVNSLFAVVNNRVFRSDDNGDRWTAVPIGPPDRADVSGLFATSNILFAVKSGGIYRSLDNGKNWTPVSGLTGNASSISSLVAKGAALFAATGQWGIGGIYRSDTKGENWVPVNTGMIGILALAAHGNSLFAGMFGSGIYRSDDEGRNWIQVNRNLWVVLAFAVSGNDLFAGTYALGIHRSTDNGQSWNKSMAGISGAVVTGLRDTATGLFATSFEVNHTINGGQTWTPIGDNLPGYPEVRATTAPVTIGNNLFVGANGHGVYRSTDNGLSWTICNNGLPDRPAVSMLQASNNSLFVGIAGEGAAGGKIYRSANNGDSWTALNNGKSIVVNLPEYIWVTVTSLVVSSETLFVGTIRSWALADVGGEVYRSTDRGQSWTLVNNGLPWQLLIRGLLVNGNSLFAATSEGYHRSPGSGVYRSDDNGASWARVSNGLNGNSLNVNALLANGNSLFAGTSGGVYRSNDKGQNWTRFGSGPANPCVSSLAMSDTRLFAGTCGSSVWLLFDSTQSWTERNSGLTNKGVNAVAVGGGNWYAGTQGSGVFRSANQGQSWTAGSGLPANANVQSIEVSGSAVFAGTFGNGVYRSTNGGANWTAASNGLTDNYVNVVKAGGGALFAGTNNGVFRSTDNGANWAAAGLNAKQALSLAFIGGYWLAGTNSGLYLSTDQGVNWEPVNSGLTNTRVNAIRVNADGTAVFAGTDGGVFRSTNGGRSWEKASRDLPENALVTSFEVVGSKLYAGTIYGVFLSEDNGNNWKQINAGLLNIYVTSLAVSGNTLIAGTKSGGVFISEIPQSQ